MAFSPLVSHGIFLKNNLTQHSLDQQTLSEIPFMTNYLVIFVTFTAFVGSAALGMIWFASPLAGYFCDRFGCRITGFLGGLLCMTSLLCSSFVHSLSLMYLTYSLVLGLGGCFLYNSYYLVIALYFKKKLSIATGIVAMGSSLGITFQGPLLQTLLDSFGWRGTFRIMSISFALASLLSLSFNPNVQENSAEENVDNENNNKDDDGSDHNKSNIIAMYCSVWRIPTYTFVVVSLMFGSFGIYIPFIYLVGNIWHLRSACSQILPKSSDCLFLRAKSI